MKRVVTLIVLVVILFFLWGGREGLEKNPLSVPNDNVKVVTEESVAIDTVKKVGPSVVTVAEEVSTNTDQRGQFDPFFLFELPDTPESPEVPDETKPVEPQNIGSGFIVSADGLIVTNKHVVSSTETKYQVITSNDVRYDVQKVYRDPLTDVAIIKIDSEQHSDQKLAPVSLGDSTKLQVGQFVIAIGTALGEFKNTVTTGVISGLSRGITAGNFFAGEAEDIENVIQTDAAINPGNSGGPLLNSSGQVIGVNTAVAQNGQNIGFALPVNVIRASLKNFNETGQFNRPYLGVAYKLITRENAIQNNVPEGAYVQRVVADSAADKAGIRPGDIITKIDNVKIQTKNEPSTIIGKKKVGNTITIVLWRENEEAQDGSGETIELKATLDVAPSQ
ncbi:MAG: trypsin-like peptidase domain-containing protein [Candidatus Levybacteria bacterium]|nr:trypsin-like peptidase domain-containing protein [Candidatus Levybacteria bacterium]